MVRSSEHSKKNRTQLPSADCKFLGNCKSVLVPGSKIVVRSSEHPEKTIERGAAAFLPRFWPVSGPFWVRLGVRVRVTVRDRSWVGSACVP